MTRRQRGLAGLTAAFLAGVGLQACFIESASPASFRFVCDVDTDCADSEVCANNLCQTPCGTEGAAECPGDAPICFNGYCSSICPVDDDVCPGDQVCFSLGEDTGLCTVMCDDTDNPCAEGQLCLEGVCATTCVDDTDCGTDETCLEGLNVCAPS